MTEFSTLFLKHFFDIWNKKSIIIKKIVQYTIIKYTVILFYYIQHIQSVNNKILKCNNKNGEIEFEKFQCHQTLLLNIFTI